MISPNNSPSIQSTPQQASSADIAKIRFNSTRKQLLSIISALKWRHTHAETQTKPHAHGDRNRDRFAKPYKCMQRDNRSHKTKETGQTTALSFHHIPSAGGTTIETLTQLPLPHTHYSSLTMKQSAVRQHNASTIYSAQWGGNSSTSLTRRANYLTSHLIDTVYVGDSRMFHAFEPLVPENV